MLRTTFLIAVGLFSFLFGSPAKGEDTPTPAPAPSPVPKPAGPKPAGPKPAGPKPAGPKPAGPKPEDMGRELRKMMLSETPKDLGIEPSTEFPRIYGVFVEWPLGGNTATIVSISTGAASLYTTSTFGIIGGEGSERVAKAAKVAVRTADKHFDAAKPVKEFPYPPEGKVYFYLLGFDGVRMLETDMAGIEKETSPYLGLFYRGQEVLTQLRLAVEKKDQEKGKE